MNQYYEAAYINALEKIAEDGEGFNPMPLVGVGLAGAGGYAAYKHFKPGAAVPVAEVAKAAPRISGKAGAIAAGVTGVAGIGAIAARAIMKSRAASKAATRGTARQDIMATARSGAQAPSVVKSFDVAEQVRTGTRDKIMSMAKATLGQPGVVRSFDKAPVSQKAVEIVKARSNATAQAAAANKSVDYAKYLRGLHADGAVEPATLKRFSDEAIDNVRGYNAARMSSANVKERFRGADAVQRFENKMGA